MSWRSRRLLLALLLSFARQVAVEAQAPAGRIPMGAGAAIVQTLSSLGADREWVHRVRLASDSGLHYEWVLEEVHETGDTVRQEFRYLEERAPAARGRKFAGDSLPGVLDRRRRRDQAREAGAAAACRHPES